MTLQARILSEMQVPFPPAHENNTLTRADAGHKLTESREPRAYGFVMAAGAFHASAERAVPARLLA